MLKYRSDILQPYVLKSKQKNRPLAVLKVINIA